MLDAAYVPVHFLRTLVQLLADEEGLSTEYCLSGTGLTWDQCLQPDGLVDFATQIQVYEAVQRLSTLPGIGFRSPSARSFADHGMLGALMLMAPDLQTALTKLVDYIDVVGGLVDYQILRNERELVIRAQDKVQFSPKMHILVAEENLTAWRHLALPVPGLEQYLTQICLDYPRPRNWRMYSDLFPHCEIRFNHSHVQAVLSANVLRLELPASNPEAFKRIELECQSIVERLSQPARSTKILVDEFLLRNSPSRWNITDIVVDLNTSERTLRRRLASEHTRLNDILDQHRFRRAQSLLALGETDARVAADLGYRSSETFKRAFRRWAGCSLAQYRQRVVLGSE